MPSRTSAGVCPSGNARAISARDPPAGLSRVSGRGVRAVQSLLALPGPVAGQYAQADLGASDHGTESSFSL
jgi:hypothetical protein